MEIRWIKDEGIRAKDSKSYFELVKEWRNFVDKKIKEIKEDEYRSLKKAGFMQCSETNELVDKEYCDSFGFDGCKHKGWCEVYEKLKRKEQKKMGG